jgi:hypothetical protein
VTAKTLLRELASLGITLTPNSNQLQVTAPPGALTAGLRDRIAANKPALLALLSPNADRLLAVLRYEGLPDSLLARDDSTAAQLAAMTAAELVSYAHALHATAEREAGRQPAGWDHASLCALCGPVWLWRGAAAYVEACPWCANRKARKPIPRPLVQCCTCRYFVRDAINPADGWGACTAGCEPTKPYPEFRRRCGTWRPKGADSE